MKKLLALLLALVMVVSLAACASDTKEPAADDSQTETPDADAGADPAPDADGAGEDSAP